MPRPILKPALLILAGCLLGSLFTGALLVVHYGTFFQEQYYLGILDNTNVAYLIRAGRQEELLRNIDANLTECVLAADKLYGSDQKRLPTFWFIQRYYQTYDIPIPEQIAPILQSLPARPLSSCKLKELPQTTHLTDADQRARADAQDPSPQP